MTFNAVQETYALPGTNHALLSNQPSRDNSRQQAYVQTSIDNMTSATSNQAADRPTGLPANTEIDANRRTTPYCFVADTDSIPYIVDSGANRVILNDAKLFKSFTAQRGAVKGVGGNPVSIIGTGTLELSLRSDEGAIDKIEIENAVYVPSSPYNLIPPQLLINQLKRTKYDVAHAKHDDREYVFTYRPTSGKCEKSRTLTVPIGENNLFTFRSNDG